MIRAVALAYGLVLASLVTSANAANTDPKGFVLTEDVGVEFAVTSSSPFLPGEPIDFVLTVTNHGDESIEFLALLSSTFVHELFPGPADCFLITQVGDGKDFYIYNLAWFVSGAAGDGPLEPGESRTCHFQMALTSAAPAVFPFTFGLPNYYTDPNPANDRFTLYLRRGDLLPTTLPSNSPLALVLLGLGLVVAARSRIRRAMRVRP